MRRRLAELEAEVAHLRGCLEVYAKSLRLVAPGIADEGQRALLEELATQMQRTAAGDPTPETPGAPAKNRKIGKEGR